MSFENEDTRDHSAEKGYLEGMTEADTVISVRDLYKHYRIYGTPAAKLKELLFLGRRDFHRKFWALKGISLDVRKGETVGIVGRNGSGKSTLLQIVCDTLVPTSGEVHVRGKVAALLELGSGFSPEFTGKENVYMSGAIWGLSNHEIDEKYDEIVGFADIGDFVNQPVKKYSSGMYVRLAFAVAINVDPDILVIDEALAVGDLAFRAKCYERIQQLRRSCVTILLVSHDIQIVKSLCDRALYLKEGVVQAVGDPADIGEMYAMDARAEQRASSVKASPVEDKESIGAEKSLAFGTDQGRVLQAIFIENGRNQSVFKTGDIVRLRVVVLFTNALKNPSLSLIIQDNRLIVIGGKYVSLQVRPDDDGLTRATLLFSFKASLKEGSYFLTVRLEERTSDTVFFPVDKQVRALAFDILSDREEQIIGMVDFEIECRDERDGRLLTRSAREHDERSDLVQV